MDNITSANHKGLLSPQKHLNVLNFYQNKNYSIICLQDTHFIPEIDLMLKPQGDFKCVFNSYRSNDRGVAILLNNNFEYEIHNKKGGWNFLALDIIIVDNRTTTINIYGSNRDDPEFFNMFWEAFTKFDNTYLMVCGDLILLFTLH